MAKQARATQGLRRSPVVCECGEGGRSKVRMRGRAQTTQPLSRRHTYTHTHTQLTDAGSLPEQAPEPVRGVEGERVSERKGARAEDRGRVRIIKKTRARSPPPHPVRSASMPGARMRTKVQVQMVSRTTDRKAVKSKRALMVWFEREGEWRRAPPSARREGSEGLNLDLLSLSLPPRTGSHPRALGTCLPVRVCPCSPRPTVVDRPTHKDKQQAHLHTGQPPLSPPLLHPLSRPRSHLPPPSTDQMSSSESQTGPLSRSSRAASNWAGSTAYRSRPPMPPKPRQNWEPSWLLFVTNSSAHPNFL